MKDTFFLSTAIDYVNALPHLGTAYEKIGRTPSPATCG